MWNKPRVVPPPPRKPVVVPPPVKFKTAEPVPGYFDSVTGLQISPASTSTQRPKPELVPGYFDFVTGLQVSSPRMRFPKPELVPVYFDSVTGLQISPPGSSEPSTSTRCPKPSCSPSMKLFQKWEAEKTAKMQELVVPETLCHEDSDSSSEKEYIQEEVGNDDENQDAHAKDFTNNQTKETLPLQHHRGANQGANDKDFTNNQTKETLPLQHHRGANQGANDKDFTNNQTKETLPLQHHRGANQGANDKYKDFIIQQTNEGWQRRRSDKKRSNKRNNSSRKRKWSNYADDGKKQLCKIDIRELRYSQLSVKQTFQCGRSVAGLVQDLLDRKVRLSSSFLRLTVFETRDEETDEIIFRCIDNRRLFALKEYYKKTGKPFGVNVDFFNYDTVRQFERFQQNSDWTDGKGIRLRKNKKRNKNQT